MYAGFDVEIAEAAATGSVNFAGKVIDSRIQDACQDRYIATVIERARVATLHKELSAARHAY